MKYNVRVYDQSHLWINIQTIRADKHEIKDGYLRILDLDNIEYVFAKGQWHSFTAEKDENERVSVIRNALSELFASDSVNV